MKYIINYSNDTAFNIALEEYAFKHLLDEDQMFLLWINKPSIIVGRHQNTIEEMFGRISQTQWLIGIFVRWTSFKDT